MIVSLCCKIVYLVVWFLLRDRLGGDRFLFAA